MNIMPIDIKLDLTPLSQCAADIIASTHKGVVKLMDLFFGSVFANQIRDWLLRDAQSRADASAVENGKKRYEDGVLMDVIAPSAVGNISELFSNAVYREEITNFIKALSSVTKLLNEIPQERVSNDSIQKTFINRWRKEVELVDDEKLRTLWAKIMTQEVVKPGSVSLRTMDVVRNLSAEEAHLFERMIKGEFYGIIPVNGEGYPQYVDYSEALRLQNAGLIFAQQSQTTFQLVYSIDEKKKGTAIPLHKDGLVVCADRQGYSTQCYILTDAGKCLLPVAQAKRELPDFIAMVDRMSKMQKGVVLSLHTIKENNGPRVVWNSFPLWTSKVDKSAEAGSEEDRTKGNG